MKKLTIRSADQTRRADVELEEEMNGQQLVDQAVGHWAMPKQADYALVNTTTGTSVNLNRSLQAQVKDGDVLEVQPVLVAGGVASSVAG
jgi:hypothetical protein